MNDPLLLLFLIAAIGGVVWWTTTQRSVFVVRLVNGKPQAAHGTVTAAFLAEIGDAARRHGIASGTIRGVPRNGRIALGFSHAFPPNCQQQLRNVWTAQSWSMPSARARNR